MTGARKHPKKNPTKAPISCIVSSSLLHCARLLLHPGLSHILMLVRDNDGGDESDNLVCISSWRHFCILHSQWCVKGRRRRGGGITLINSGCLRGGFGAVLSCFHLIKSRALGRRT